MPSNSNKSCAVPTCPNPKGVSYHRFPKETTLRAEWVKRCAREKQFDANSLRICARHFAPEDYERDLKNELLGLPTVKKLKPNSCPSRNLPGFEEEPSSPSEKNRVLLQSILHDHTCLEISTSSSPPHKVEVVMEGKPSFDKYKKSLLSSKEGSPPFTHLGGGVVGETLLWKQKFLRLQTDHKKSQETSSLLRQELRAAKKEVRTLKSQKYQKTIIKEFLLKNNYSASQVKKLMNPKLKFCQSYDKDEMTMSLVLRSISKKAFDYIRSKNVLPLPCKRTQAKWLNEFKNKPALQEDYLKILQEMGS